MIRIRPRLLKTLTEREFPRASISWIETFLSDRKASLRFDGEEDDMTAVMTGIPQGSSESSIIFLLYVKLFFDTLEKTNSQTRCPSYVGLVDGIVITACETQRWLGYGGLKSELHAPYSTKNGCSHEGIHDHLTASQHRKGPEPERTPPSLYNMRHNSK